MTEKFTSYDLNLLGVALSHCELDLDQASTIVSAFLNGRGYGADAGRVREVAIRMGEEDCEPALLHAELERAALVM